MTELIQTVCEEAGVLPEKIGVISIVGNPAMQQLFLGISPENLSRVPFAPVLTEAKAVPCGERLPICKHARLLIVPNIAGYVGADTVGCILATGLYAEEKLTLLVDIGTNGEIVLGNKDRMIACATAAGPALEGANIQFGMRASDGAIDHVWLENGEMKYSVIGGGSPKGICGSGLIDAIAVGLKLGQINKRGRIQREDRIFPLTQDVYLTQEDIRQVQLAKGAICAGITLLTKQLGVELRDIQKVQLAGAFGSFMNPENACRIGLLPEELLERIEVVGNAALSGAKMLALDGTLLPLSQKLTQKTEFLELASLPSFPKTFAKGMLFREEDPVTRWLEKAKELGFDMAVAMDPQALTAREDVRAMCAEDKCGAYNKNWTCPPAVGTTEECQRKMRQYRQGILLQSIGHMSKAVDSKCYRETERRHMQNFYILAEWIRKEHPDALCLGAGGCRVCRQCSYPEPCRFPDKAVSSMEGYGLFVTQVCRDAGVAYHRGDRTITYTACILF
jgi:predicted metal-binding protein